jgi:hypothetical protein
VAAGGADMGRIHLRSSGEWSLLNPFACQCHGTVLVGLSILMHSSLAHCATQMDPLCSSSVTIIVVWKEQRVPADAVLSDLPATLGQDLQLHHRNAIRQFVLAPKHLS